MKVVLKLHEGLRKNLTRHLFLVRGGIVTQPALTRQILGASPSEPANAAFFYEVGKRVLSPRKRVQVSQAVPLYV